MNARQEFFKDLIPQDKDIQQKSKNRYTNMLKPALRIAGQTINPNQNEERKFATIGKRIESPEHFGNLEPVQLEYGSLKRRKAQKTAELSGLLAKPHKSSSLATIATLPEPLTFTTSVKVRHKSYEDLKPSTANTFDELMNVVRDENVAKQKLVETVLGQRGGIYFAAPVYADLERSSSSTSESFSASSQDTQIEKTDVPSQSPPPRPPPPRNYQIDNFSSLPRKPVTKFADNQLQKSASFSYVAGDKDSLNFVTPFDKYISEPNPSVKSQMIRIG